jgi:4-amino-4-deoxy-L-arabinose transferase-like glycosyltransferase
MRRFATLFTGLLLLTACSFPFLYDLDRFPIFQWDEARYANNSLEMFLHGDFLNVRMEGEIDTWNFKPPLVLWLQVLCMKVLGPGEWAVRLPSALAGLTIVALMFWFCATVLKSRTAGIMSALFFVASGGFISPHVARSGDLDAVLTFFLFAYALLFIRYLFDKRPPGKTFVLLAILVICAFLCKGIPGFFMLPFLFVISFLHDNWRKVFLHRSLYWSAVTILLAGAGYYWLRELSAPGYWELLKASEFNRFSGKGVEWHRQPFDFYYRNFIELKRFYPLVYFLPLTLSVFWTTQSAQTRRFYLYCLIVATGYFLFISYPPVKLEWYDAPLYPFFALMLGLATTKGVGWLARKANFGKKPPVIFTVSLLLTLLLCATSYRHIHEKIQYAPQKMSVWEIEGTCMKQLRDARPEERQYTVFKQVNHPEHLDQVRFYQKAWGRRFGYRIDVKDNPSQLLANEKVLVCRPEMLDFVRQHFQYETLFETEQGRLLLLK